MTARPLDDATIASALAGLPGWRRDDGALAIAWRFGSFEEAMAWMHDCIEDIDLVGHHPDWRNIYDRIDIRLTTHDAGERITAKDIDLAKRMQWRADGYGAVVIG